MAVRAIDCWVNVNMGDQAPADYLIRVKEDYFRGGDEFFRNIEVEELVDSMDRLRVEKCVLSIGAEQPSEKILEFARKHPTRFGFAAGVDPRRGMKALWALESLARNEPVVMARVVPFMYDLAPNTPEYFPLYTKCVDLDLPISVNTGIPGPPMPGECQHPMHLDKVCLYFPELRICMAHGADPWWGEAIRLMIKYKNLYLMTSAYAPRYLPAQLLQFMNTRGKDKIIFASDHPVLSTERCLTEAQELDLRPGVLDKYLYENASRLFFAARRPH